MLVNTGSYILKKYRCPLIRRMSPVLETNVSNLGNILPIGRQYEKNSYFRHFQTVLRILLRKSAC